MMKRFLALLLVLIMCFSLFACGKGSEEPKITEDGGVTEAPESIAVENTEPVNEDDAPGAESKITPLLYKVSDNEGNVIWLFGSIHIGIEEFYPLPDYVTNAFNSSESAAFEFDILAVENDVNAQVNTMLAMMCTDGRTIEDYLSEEEYDEAVAILTENNLYFGLLDMYMPVLWSSLIDNLIAEKAGTEAELGIDRCFLKLAKTQGKEILEIESNEFQTNMLASYSDGLQEILLASSIYAYRNMDETLAEYDKMLEAWAMGDKEGLNSLFNGEIEFESEEEKALYEEYNYSMVVSRNANMTDYAENALKSGKEVFICVGAAHIVCDGAMTDQLSQRGYTVEEIRE